MRDPATLLLRRLGAAAAMVLMAGCAAGRVGSEQSPAALAPQPGLTSTAPSPATNTLPLPFGTGNSTQVVTVVAPTTASSTATLQAWDKTSAGWLRRGGALHAYIGNQGLTAQPRETLAATPIGSFTLTETFGLVADPGTRLPYFTADLSDYWVADPNSRHYNTHYRCARNCPFDTGAGENLYRVGDIYTYAVVMDYNRFPVRPGAGSAFFLHVTENKPTTGCVSIPKPDLVAILRWLDPAAHPRILVGVAG